MRSTITAYGLDPSVKHGALVRGTWTFELGGEVSLVDYQVIETWTYRKVAEVSLEELTLLAQRLNGGLKEAMRRQDPSTYQVQRLAIDWDLKLSAFGGQRMVAVKLGFFMGAMISGLVENAIAPVMIPPRAIRRAVGRKASDEKALVWERVAGLPSQESSDIKDALLLSYFLAVAAWNDEAIPWVLAS